MRKAKRHSMVSERHEQVANTLITRKELTQFQEIISEEYGVTLTAKQAYILAITIIIIIGTLLEIYFAFRLLFGTNTK